MHVVEEKFVQDVKTRILKQRSEQRILVSDLKRMQKDNTAAYETNPKKVQFREAVY
jgi:hypothetical protein